MIAQKTKRNAIKDVTLCFLSTEPKGECAFGRVHVFLDLEGLKRLWRKEVLHIELLG